MEVTLRKDYHLVLSFDTPNEELQKTLLEVVKEAGRNIEGAAKLAHGAVADGGGKPTVTLYSDDFLMGKEEFELQENNTKSG